MFPEVVHPVVGPLSTAFYNLFALVGIFPKVISEDQVIRSQHHLRYNLETSANDSLTAPVAKSVDPVSERRRAKAMVLLDAKMAELSKESIGWDETESNKPLDETANNV